METSTVTSLHHLHGRARKHIRWPFLSSYRLTVMCVGHAETTWVGSLEIQCMSLGGGERQRECCIDNCRDISFVSSHIVNSKYEEALPIANLKCSILIIPNPTPLCKKHYHMLYNILWPTQRHCITCSKSLWHCSSKTCPSPVYSRTSF